MDRSVEPPVEFRVIRPALLIAPFAPPPAIVKTWLSLRVSDSAPPSVRLAIVGLMLMRTGLLVALVMITLAPVNSAQCSASSWPRCPKGR